MARGTNQSWIWLAALVWAAPCLVITVQVAARPLKRTVTPLYHDSVERWQQRQPLYDGPRGMNYLPTFIPLFAPYHALGLPVSDILWRWTAIGGLAAGLWGFTRQKHTEPTQDPPARAFALVSLLGVPLCLGALSNGQANAHLSAALLGAALCLANDWAWGAALFLALAAATKPLGLAAGGLAVLAFPRLWWRAGVALGVVLAMPFLLAPPAYAYSQFLDAFQNLRQCSAVTEHRFADLNGLLRTLGVPLGGTASLLVRAGAGAGLALFCVAVLRPRPKSEGALAWLGVASTYLMLFNPMTESNSYAAFGPVAALWTWRLFTIDAERLGWLLVAMLATMGLLPTLLRPWLGNQFALAWYPAMALLFLGVLGYKVCQIPAANSAPQPPPAL